MPYPYDFHYFWIVLTAKIFGGHTLAIPDLINGIFETLGAVTGFLNCWQLHKDRRVMGVMWQLWFFYCAWGLWNLYYYPHLNQWISFAGGCLIVTSNIIWIL